MLSPRAAADPEGVMMKFTVFLPGCEDLKKFGKLIRLTKIRSEAISDALRDHLVNGHPIPQAAAFNSVDESNLKRALKKLEETAQVIEEIKEIDWPNYQITRFKKVS